VPGFTFVLHSHIPYCRQTGRWPHGEEWIHEAIAETYLPLLSGLHDLHDEGVPYRLMLGITPVLAEQLADPDVQVRFVQYAQGRLAAAAEDVARFAPRGAEPDRLRQTLASWYRDWYSAGLAAFQERFGQDLVGACRTLEEAGRLAIATSAATHAYLPLLGTDGAVAAQLATAVRSHRRHFGAPPPAIWLPECAYRPGYATQRDGRVVTRPGLETFLEAEGLPLFFVETHSITGGVPVGKAAGDAIGPYGGIPERELLPVETTIAPTATTTYHPYQVGDSRVTAIGRDNRTSMQVWSSHIGYPGDPAYREFHRKDAGSGFQYWRVTGADVDLGAKELYDPAAAAARVEAHADHFVAVVEATAAQFQAEHGEGLIASTYDTELFGHWWFEGPAWLVAVLRRLAGHPTIQLTTAVDWVAAHPPRHRAAILEGSWGKGGTHHTWDNPQNHWMWPLIHAAERRMEGLVARFPDATGGRLVMLNQTARELLLLQSSDWPFLVATGQATEYATLRFTEHLAKFNRLAYLAEVPVPSPEAMEVARQTWEQDKVFPDIDYRDWAERPAPGGGRARRP
jgi:1,4-alpha-glucan branching enzyme